MVVEQLDPIDAQMAYRGAKMFKDTTGLGIDLWEPILLKSMSEEAAQAIADLLNNIESKCAWPMHLLLNVIVLMGKPPPGGVRPIALLPVLYRLWARIRKQHMDQWEVINKGPWDAAVKGSSA